MSSPEYAALHIIHILALLGLVGAIFYACAAAPEQRKRTLIWSGVASVLVAASGARMSQGIFHGMPGWVWIKLACWLGLAALVGFCLPAPRPIENVDRRDIRPHRARTRDGVFETALIHHSLLLPGSDEQHARRHSDRVRLRKLTSGL